MIILLWYSNFVLRPSKQLGNIKGSSKVSILDDNIFGGGTTIVTFSLAGELNMLIQSLISGKRSFNIWIVFEVAVAVINNVEPPMVLSSPELKDITGLNAFFNRLSTPQLATINHIMFLLDIVSRSTFWLLKEFLRKCLWKSQSTFGNLSQLIA